MASIHCPECGFVNAEGANYCQKCGAYLGRPEGAEEQQPTTMSYRVDETGEYQPVDLEEEVDRVGAALVIRSGRRALGRELHDRPGAHEHRSHPRCRRLP